MRLVQSRPSLAPPRPEFVGTMKRIARALLPPIVTDAYRQLRRNGYSAG